LLQPFTKATFPLLIDMTNGHSRAGFDVIGFGASPTFSPLRYTQQLLETFEAALPGYVLDDVLPLLDIPRKTSTGIIKPPSAYSIKLRFRCKDDRNGPLIDVYCAPRRAPRPRFRMIFRATDQRLLDLNQVAEAVRVASTTLTAPEVPGAQDVPEVQECLLGQTEEAEEAPQEEIKAVGVFISQQSDAVLPHRAYPTRRT
jgi:hypothetical protein